MKDKSSVKDILKLVQPTSATDDLKALFENQVVPLNEVVLADRERDRSNNAVSVSFFPMLLLMKLYLFLSSLSSLKNAQICSAFTTMNISSLFNYRKNLGYIQKFHVLL